MIVITIEKSRRADQQYLLSVAVNKKIKYARYAVGLDAGGAAASAVRAAMGEVGQYCIIAPTEVLNMIPESVRSGFAN